MKEYERKATITLKKRLLEPVRSLIVVAGPRQIGKTTAVNQALAQSDKALARLQGKDRMKAYHFHAVDSPEENTSDWSSLDSTSEVIPAPPILPSERDEKWLISKWQLARKAALQWQQAQAITSGDKQLTDQPSVIPFILVFDEIQNIPNWSSTAKGLWDQDRLKNIPMHVVVLGSAPLLMQQGISESLMGRYEMIQMTHWSYEEMRDSFGYTLNQYLYFGGYPGPAEIALENEERWRDIIRNSLIEPNLVKDILALAKIEKPAVLRQLFELGCTYSGQIVAMKKLLIQLEDVGNTTTLSHYLSLLKAAGLLAGLEKFAYQTIRQRASPPKLNALNTAFLSVYSGYSFAQAQENPIFWGHLVESSVGAHLINTAQDNIQINYWRESSLEVDFVLFDGKNTAALEVKSAKPRPDVRKGLRAFDNSHSNLKAKLHLAGGNEFLIAEALTKTAAEWLDD